MADTERMTGMENGYETAGGYPATEETLQAILEQTTKEARFSRLLAMIMFAIMLLLLLVIILVVPRALSMIAEIEKTARDAQTAIATVQETLGTAQETLTDLRSTMEGVGEMTQSITKTGNALFEGIGKVDFDALAKAITDLQDAVEPLANFSRVLSGR